jgi:hypothetical protein
MLPSRFVDAAQRLGIAQKLTKQNLLYLAAALFATAPAWIVKYPPLVDLPFHLAAMRTIHSLGDPVYGLSEHFVLTLGRTQYLAYYLAGSALSYVVGVVNANIVLMSVYLGGTVLALRDLLAALGKDERLCLFVIPLLVNVLFMLGLLPFLLGIPVMFWALAAAVRWFEQPTRKRGIVLGLLALLLFYSHIFPFAIFAIGFAAMFPWSRPRSWRRVVLPVLPAAAAAAWWATFTQAGRLTSGAVTGTEERARPLDQAIADIPNWFTNVFRDDSEERIIIALSMLVVISLGIAMGERGRPAKPAVSRYGLLLAVCIVLYFTLPGAHGYISLIYQRLPVVFALCAIPLLPMPRGLRGQLVTVSAAAIAMVSVINTCRQFIRFQLEQVGDFDAVIAAMEPKKKLCALIFESGSSLINYPSFLHFGSYYQLKKGGVVQFTYAGYAHWPVDFRPGKYPPPHSGPARLRWEWTPEQVPIEEIFPYYDYVLTRGGEFNPPSGTYRLKLRRDRWSLWVRD